MVAMPLGSELRLMGALFIALMCDTPMRIHIGEIGCDDCAL
jgi:hypothetical protein